MATNLILITGHPATGKTTLARKLGIHFNLPTFCKDDGKEILFDRLGSGDRDWILKLGVVSFDLLFWQAEVMLKVGLSCIIEANFDPRYANDPWQALQQKYSFQCIQLLCAADVDVVMKRYQQRIDDGTRHPGHFSDGTGDELRRRVLNDPAAFIDVEGERIMVDTTTFGDAEFKPLTEKIQALINLR